MKRSFIMLLALFACFALLGCAKAEEPAEPTASPTATPTATPSPTPEPTPEPEADYGTYTLQKQFAVGYLSAALESCRSQLTVYGDFAETENNYTQKALMYGTNRNLVKDMNENWTENPYSGRSCIRCEIDTSGLDWGGWLFLNGYLPKGETVPKLNDGSRAGEGLDLTGATALRFWARGETGSEIVEFFTAGFGYDGEWGIPLVDFPDTAKKQSLGFVQLSTEWTEYTIPLRDLDLSSIVCGFGYVCSGTKTGDAANVFYLDDIRFVGRIESLKTAPVLLRSYETDNIYIQNAAFSYDNALAAMAFLSEGMQDEAGQILDAFVYAVEHDRYEPGRVRNAYAAGSIEAFPGWESGARLPGWYDPETGETGTWFEDRYQVGSNVGNTSYVALALLQYDALYGSETYRKTAETLMDWVIDTCSDGSPGFVAGYDGWPEGKTPTVYPFTYKSIEHNIDAYAAFTRLYALTGNARYRTAAESALTLITSMYDESAGVFYTGTGDDGVTPSKDNIVLDAQVWSMLALGDAFTPYETSFARAEGMRLTDGGYPFCETNANGGWWAEGTAYTALALRLQGKHSAAEQAFGALCSIQLESGAFPAATVDNLSTGFNLFTGEPWVYSTDAHIAPTAWFIMALNGFNPYQF